jgi:hypothetical protein
MPHTVLEAQVDGITFGGSNSTATDTFIEVLQYVVDTRGLSIGGLDCGSIKTSDRPLFPHKDGTGNYACKPLTLPDGSKVWVKTHSSTDTKQRQLESFLAHHSFAGSVKILPSGPSAPQEQQAEGCPPGYGFGLLREPLQTLLINCSILSVK